MVVATTRWGKCDFRQLQALQKRLEKLASKDFDAFCRAAARELAARLLAKVIKRTPVGKTQRHPEQGPDGRKRMVTDHMGGTLRRGWTAKTEAEAQGGGTKAGAEYAHSLPISRRGSTYQIEIVNPVHYASYVEYGHRQTPGRYVPALGKCLKQGWVKGRFMLTISEQELQAMAPGLLEEKLTGFLEECFSGGG